MPPIPGTPLTPGEPPTAPGPVPPASGYDRAMIQAVPGYGYVFQRLESVQYHYMALRVTAVTRQYVIFDWSVQTDPGNPELVVPKRPATSGQAVASR